MDINQPHCVAMLHSYGFVDKGDPTMKYATADEPGRADRLAIHNGKGCAIEIKNGAEGFDLSKWTLKQRNWALEYCENPPFNVRYWIFLTMGSQRAGSNTDKPRRSWLIPRWAMVEVCELVEPIQKMLPYRAGAGYNIILQQHKYDAVHLFEPYELKWGITPNGKTGWVIPAEHEFHKLYIKE